MGTIAAQSILDAAVVILQDKTGVRWPAGELLPWLNDGQREIVLLKPSAYSINTPIALATGTRQRIPANGIQLLDVVRNIGQGDVPGRAVRLIAREILDAQLPGWHSLDPQDEIKHYTYTVDDPKSFYVYPPANGVNRLEIVYSAAPPEVSAAQAISVDDIFKQCLIDYVLYRAYSKDAEYAGNAGRAGAHYQAFLFAVTGRTKAELEKDPNSNQHGNPNSRPPRA
jgi:hypothetical protein